MSIQTVERPSFAAQMGGNIGKTLAEQIPQVVQRYRLSNALKGMQGQNLSPMDYAQKIVGAGGTLQDVSALLPILHQTQNKQILEEQARGGKTPPSLMNQLPESNAAQPTGEFATPKQLEEMEQSRFQEPEQADVARLALQYGGTAEAENKARQMLKDRADLQEKGIGDLHKLINEGYEYTFQSGGLKDFHGDLISGRTKNWFLKQGEYLMRNGWTKEAAAQKINQDMQNLGDSMLQAATIADEVGFMGGKSLDAALPDIQTQRDIAKKYEQTDQFDKVIIKNLGLSPNVYYSKLAPITDDKLLKEIQKSIKSVEYFKKNVIPRISPDDNPQSILDELIKYGTPRHAASDSGAYLKAMRDAVKAGKLHLSEENKKILKDFMPQSLSLRDIWFGR